MRAEADLLPFMQQGNMEGIELRIEHRLAQTEIFPGFPVDHAGAC